MLYEIFSLLLEVSVGLLTGTCLLRLYMQYQRIPMSARSGNPMGRFIFALTDWVVLPLRRVVPSVGRWDMASLLAAYLLQLAEFSLLWLLAGPKVSVASIAVLAAFGIVRMAITGLVMLVIAYSVLSWVQTQSFVADLLDRLVSPALSPVRRMVPLVGGVDLSPLVLLVLLQIALIVLGKLQGVALLALTAY
ncbi:YggT family protein [Rhodoferax aquaticus]|uniref:YggT family protein n=1 Tax=Rhodoferax aquaticus TaxID=2527691 RepID=A0A515ERW6_9BURK|nr:YggT family protein [Rhodoferax aquaticus]QDL55404.1 YggT family protein [Rhodoferax aquaticus]